MQSFADVASGVGRFGLPEANLVYKSTRREFLQAGTGTGCVQLGVSFRYRNRRITGLGKWW